VKSWKCRSFPPFRRKPFFQLGAVSIVGLVDTADPLLVDYQALLFIEIWSRKRQR
jgi:hypothetical protein